MEWELAVKGNTIIDQIDSFKIQPETTEIRAKAFVQLTHLEIKPGQ
jgi:hypothetical protein